MKQLLIICVFICIAATPAVGFAGVTQGELFGYRLGDKYPTSSDTKGFYFFLNNTFELVAENPVKPKDIGEVHLITSVKSFTIISIYGITEFESNGEALSFSRKYEDFLKAKYPEAKLERNVPLNGLIFFINEKYQLATFVTQVNDDISETPTANEKEDKKPFFQINLNFTDESEIKKLIKKEYNEAVLEEAEKEGLAKGH